jgi:hypothetical protein
LAKTQAKTRTKKTAASGKEPEMMLVRLALTAATHQDFRVEAAKEGRSMANIPRRLVEEWVAKRKAATGGR